MASGQAVALGQPRFAGRAAAQKAAFGDEFRPCRPVNRTIDTAAAEQRRVCSVNDGIDGESRDVAGFESNAPRVRHDRLHDAAVPRRNAMSRAFVKEQDGDSETGEILDLPQSAHPNYT